MFLNIPIERLCVPPQASLRQVIETIQHGGKQIALVVDEERRLLGTITDGDVRRAILRNTPLDVPASEVMQRSFTAGRYGMNRFEILELMRVKSLRHIPLIDEQGLLVDLVWISDLIQQNGLEIPAVVMAGGFGRRLRPLTEKVPKPLLPVGDRPLLEIIIHQLREAGIRRIHMATHYRWDKIAQHFGDGSAYGIEISYLIEDSPLGTAGALSLLTPSDKPLLVINGDILTHLDFRAMLTFHEDHRAAMTVAVKEYHLQVPYGVITVTNEAHVVELSEKPTLRFFVNAGVYLLSPEAQRCVPQGRPYDMTDLIKDLMVAGQCVVSFPIQEYWLDIGQIEDYERAQQDMAAGVI